MADDYGAKTSMVDITILRPQRETQQETELPYDPTLRARARALRKAGDLAEVLVWRQLRNRQFHGLDFDRQKIIGRYIVDFFCARKKVVLEIDGVTHEEKRDYDARRDAFLNGLGLTVVHILDRDVRNNLQGVMDALEQLDALTAP